MNETNKIIWHWVRNIGITVIFLTILLMVGGPTYNVYTSRMEGEAILAHAQSSREVAVAEAKAKMESASLLAQADTIRAHGVAAANRIIGASLKNNPEYLQWLWIDQIEKANTIYIPTEGNMPIMEASRFSNNQRLQRVKDSLFLRSMDKPLMKN